MKNCTICKKLLPVSEFNKNNAHRDGLQNKCRECSKLHSRMYYQKNQEKHKRVVKAKQKCYEARNKQYVDDLKKQLGCAFCSENEVCCLDFHHIDPSKKSFNIARAVGGEKSSLNTIKSEIDKCVCVCSNCHRKLHAGLLQLHNLTD